MPKRAKWSFRSELNPFAPWRIWPLGGVQADADTQQWSVSILFFHAFVTRRMVPVPSLAKA